MEYKWLHEQHSDVCQYSVYRGRYQNCIDLRLTSIKVNIILQFAEKVQYVMPYSR